MPESVSNINRWKEHFDLLLQQRDDLDSALKNYINNDSPTDSLWLDEANRTLFRLEYTMHMELERAAVDVELFPAVYEAYKGFSPAYRTASINGVMWNNGGQPFSWDERHYWGAYNAYKETLAQGMHTLGEVSYAAQSLRNYYIGRHINKADIAGLAGSLAEESAKMLANGPFASFRYSRDHILQKMAADILDAGLGIANESQFDQQNESIRNLTYFILDTLEKAVEPQLPGPAPVSDLNGLEQLTAPPQETVQALLDAVAPQPSDETAATAQEPMVAAQLQSLLEAVSTQIVPLLNYISELTAIGSIAREVNEAYTNALGWALRLDPLILDLDGDGIETVSVQAGILSMR